MKNGIKKTLVLILSLMMVFSMMAMPVFADGEEPAKFPYSGENVNFIKEDGSAFGMFAPQEGTTCELDESGENVVIHYVPKNKTTYIGFNWGSIDNSIYQDESNVPAPQIKANEDGTYDITLSKDYCGYAHPIAPVKREYGGSSGTWTSDKQYYLAIPEFVDAPDKFPYGGEGVNFIKEDGSAFGMFAPQEGTTCELDESGENVVIHYVPKNKTTYVGFNWGSMDRTIYKDANYTPEPEIKANADGTYDITLSKEYCGYAHPIAPIKREYGGSSGTWTSDKQYYLAIPAFEEAPVFDYSGVTRIYGKSRYETAMLQADALKEILGLEKFNSIIVATGTNYADALSGAYLGYVKGAPILLVHDSVIKDVNNYIKENLAEEGTVYLLGGEKVVPDAVTEGLTGVQTKRLSGPDRYKTNLAILKEAGVSAEDIIVCTGNGFADSLSASAAKLPILLVNMALDADQMEYLKTLNTEKFYLAGGTGVISEGLEAYIKDNFGTVERLGGKNRYETSVMIAEAFFEKPDGAVVAFAKNYPDGLCGGTAAAYLNSPLLLVDDANIDNAVKYAVKAEIKKGLVLGGPTLVSDASARAIFSMSEDDEIKVID